MYKVTIKPGHPKGVFHRSGRAFTKEPTFLSEEEMTQAIKDEPWLIVEGVDEAEAPTAQAPVAAHEWPTKAQELIEHIEGLDEPQEVQAVLDWEMGNQGRKTVVEAAEKRLEELAETETES